MPADRLRLLTMTVPWNLFLLTMGGICFAFAVKCVAAPQGFVSGGVFGTSMLIVYATNTMNIAAWYALLNIPILILGWVCLSRRFMLYTIYCLAISTIAAQIMPWQIEIHDKILAAVFAGILCGVGAGIAVRSLGSDGGLTVISLILHQKFNLNIGTFSIVYNAVLFMAALPIISIDNLLYSMIMIYLTATLMDFFMGMFDQRKLVLIISEEHERIAHGIMADLRRGCTLLHGQGGFTSLERKILLTVVDNTQLRRLEEIIFCIDENAFVIIENSLMVLGRGFSHRKVY